MTLKSYDTCIDKSDKNSKEFWHIEISDKDSEEFRCVAEKIKARKRLGI